ncbi:MAG: type IV pilus modification PilV family protein [bacterium]
MNSLLSLNNNKGASLIEVLISMLILTFVFMGIMALSLSFINGNAMASRTNQATNIGQMQIAQLQCIGANTLNTDYAGNISSGSPVTYTVTQTANNNSFNSLITNNLGQSQICSMPAPIQGVNDNYTVNIYLTPNANNMVNAKVEVYWNNNFNEITLNTIIV